MSSRTVAVVLKAQVDDYVAQMNRAKQHTTDVEKAALSATEQFRKHNEALTSVGVGMVGVGAAAAAGMALAVKAAAEYGSKMAQLQSLSHATTGEMRSLSDAAMKQGLAFGQSASDVADAEIELTKAGRSAAQMLGGDLKGALALAAAGQIDVAKATQIGVTALTQFSASGATIPQVADALAAGADKALGSVEDLGMALNQGGLVASQMGLSLNDTVGTLSAFANAGLIGSDAGTSFKTMLLALQSPSKQSAELLQKYNISAYDLQGNFVGITNLSGQLTKAFKDKTQAERDAALSTIFGSDAIRAANVLYKEGATGIQGWIKSVDDTGFAAAQAAGKMNSLQGDAKKLAAAFQTDLIKAGSSADGSLRGLVQTATALVTIIGEIPQPVMGVGVGLTALVAGVGLVGGTALIAVPKIVAFRASLDELGISGRKAAGVIGKGGALAVGIGLVASGIAGLAQHGTADAQQIAQAGETIKSGWKDFDKTFDNGGFANAMNGFSDLKGAISQTSALFGGGNAAKFLDSVTLGITHFSDSYKTAEAQFDALGQQLAGLAQQDYGAASKSFGDLVKQYHLSDQETGALLKEMPAYRDELVKLAEAAKVSASDHNLLLIAQGKGAVSAKVLAAAQEEAAHSAAEQQAGIDSLAGSATDAKVDIKALSDAIAGFGSVTLDARSAQRDFRAAVDAAREAAKKAGDASSDSTKADRDKQAALDEVAKSAIATAAAFAKQPGGIDKATQAMKDGRKAFVDIATEMLHSKTKANDLADSLGLIPENVKTAYELQGVTSAEDEIKKIKALIGGVPSFMRTQVSIDAIMSAQFNGTGPLVTKAGGGPIFGSGPKGVDSVRAILAPGEHVLTAQEVDRMGGQAAVSAFRADLMGVQAFAKGGPVSPVDQAKADVKKYQDSVKSKQKTVDKDEDAVDRTKKGTKARTAAEKKLADDRKKLDADQKKLQAAQDSLYLLQGGDYGDAGRKQDDAQDDATDAKKRYDTAKKAADKAEKKYKAAQDAAQKIHGKGTADAKHAAEVRVKELQRAKEAADKKEATAKDAYDKAADRLSTARDNRTSLSRDREDFVSAERRDPTRASSNPLDYVDQLRSMSRDDQFSSARRKTFDDAANKYEASLVDLGKKAEAAATTLDTLKDSSKQMHDSIQQSITGGFSLGSAAQRQTQSGWMYRDGIAFQTTSGGPSASSIAGYYTQGAQTAAAFADTLRQLAGRGLSGSLLAELAQMGTDQGLPIAQAILAGSQDDLNAINSGYGAISTFADQAGSTVADANFAAQIAAADANAQQITSEIATQGEALRKVIAQAFGLKGYATGTDSATAGIHWVGERGPELVGFGGGERVLTAEQSARWVRGGGVAPSAPQPVIVQPAPVTFPDVLTVRDASGFELQMRVVAQQEIARDAAHDAALSMGGPAL